MWETVREKSMFIIRRAVRGVLALIVMGATAMPVPARTILFVGNSFTFGAHSPVEAYRPDLVTDLNHEAIGGVPALFRTFADEAKLDWQVSLETSPGKDLAWHLGNRRDAVDRAWDVVILQGLSTLDAQRPGDTTRHVAAAVALAEIVKARNPAAIVDLVTTWSRADQTYLPRGHWFGRPITAMADDLAAANALALARSHDLSAAIPVGQAWNRAFAEGVADPDPYDGVDFGKVDLWTWDQYHASAAGYYLEALTIFGCVTGADPQALGKDERAAEQLGLSPATAAALQRIAAETIAATGRASTRRETPAAKTVARARPSSLTPAS